MKTRTKIFLAVGLAILAAWLLGCQGPSREHYVSTPSITGDEVNVAYLEKTYASYNDGYFQNKLTKTPKIDFQEPTKNYMATTMCHDDGSCSIHFNLKYTIAPRNASVTLLHEMCHIETWETDVVKFAGETEQADHGKVWRACMLRLDAEGAFREIIIDNYAEEMP